MLLKHTGVGVRDNKVMLTGKIHSEEQFGREILGEVEGKLPNCRSFSEDVSCSQENKTYISQLEARVQTLLVRPY